MTVSMATRRSVQGCDLDAATAPQSPEIGIISLAIDRWGMNWKSRHQILTRLAKYFHVTWLNPAVGWRDALRTSGLRSREATPPGLRPSFVVRDSSALMPVVYRPRILGDVLFSARVRRARSALRRRGCHRIVLYIWHSDLKDALGHVPHDLSVYHIYDEYSHAEVEQAMDTGEDEFIRAVDQVITVSPTMHERKGRLNPHSAMLTNGVDYDAFALPVAEPADVRDVPRPRIGYAGVVKRQLDWDLISALVARRGDWSFVFAGARAPHPDITAILDRLAKMPNVMFLGSKSVEELARYPQHFDVCMMPYRMNDYSKYIYPLKLHEYLASGRPVVSVPLPALAGLEQHVAVACGVDEWERAIERQLLVGADADAQGRRQAEARRHDWSAIAGEIAALIERRLTDRRAP